MVTSAHEGMHRIFQERPEILTPVFEVLSVESPEKAAVDAIVSDVTEAKPLARHVDTVLRVTAADGDAFLLAVEAQERRDPKKESSWPYYIAYLNSKYGLPVLLLVACRDRATAKWAAGPFQCGVRGWTAQRTYPLVVSPDNIPPVIDERTAAEKPAMAAFSALVHANSPDVDVILDALARALARLDPDVSDYIYQFLDAALGNSPAGEKWRNLVSFVNYFPGRGTVMERAYLHGKAEGKARGEAKGILRMLQYRGLSISEQVRERITTCTDLDRLDDWLERAGTVKRAEDLFDAASEVPPSAAERG